MRRVVLGLILSVVFLVLSSRAFGQACTGSLGDPVIDENFGSGPNPGPPLAPGVTTMTYTKDNCPGDGYYTIANSVNVNCFGSSWHNLTTDRAGNPNGYMMIINASYQPSIFFTQVANGLCPSTTYEFAAYIVNLDLPNVCSGAPIPPQIVFSIETADGTVIKADTTPAIMPTSDIEWKQYSVYFTTPANTTNVVVKMYNIAPGGCGNDLALDDITFRACGPLINIGFEHTTGTPTISPICQGSTGVIVLRADVLGTSPSYQWQINTPSGWTDIPGANFSAYDAKFVNAAVGTYQFRLGVSNGSAITVVDCRVYSQPLTIVVNPLPVVPPIADQTLCVGDQLQLNATGGVSYLWRGPGLTPTTQNPLIVNNVGYNNAGTYEVVAYSDQNCPTAEIPVKVTVLPRPVATLKASVTTLCEGETTQLTATGGLHYKWTPSTGLNNDTIPNPVATPLQTTTYKVDVSNGSCSDSTQSVAITVYQNPIANAGNEIALFEGQSAKLNGTVKGDNIISYAWNPTTYLTDPTSLTPVTTPTDNITYTLTVVSKTCGQSSSSVYVRVYKKVTIPNTFSPNNDGVNDVWNIDALMTYAECTVSVFDRYGQQVFQSTGYPSPWDGINNGKPVPQGAYYYIIDLKNGTPKLTGWVLIVR